MASRYLSPWNRMEKLIWAKVWTPGLIPKINIFFWLIMQDKILTLDNLINRGQYILNWCILCKDNLESIDHMFIHCPYSLEVWDLITKDWKVSWCKPATILDFYSQWDSLYRGLKLEVISS